MTKEQLDDEWKALDAAVTEVDRPRDGYGVHLPEKLMSFSMYLDRLITAERARVDRGAMARAVRFIRNAPKPA